MKLQLNGHEMFKHYDVASNFVNNLILMKVLMPYIISNTYYCELINETILRFLFHTFVFQLDMHVYVLIYWS